MVSSPGGHRVLGGGQRTATFPLFGRFGKSRTLSLAAAMWWPVRNDDARKFCSSNEGRNI
jgi:hypothetical protein